MPVVESQQWSEFLANHPNSHVLQTTAWGELKAAFGWEVTRLVTGQTGGQLLFRHLPLGLRLGYLAKGPVGEPFPSGQSGRIPWSELWPEIDAECRAQRAFFLKVEPDLLAGDPGVPSIAPAGFRESPHSIQPPRSLMIDLQGEEEQVLARMKQKTRYNIRLAQKKGVVVRPTSDVEAFHQLLAVTAARDGFAAHSLEYYRRAYALFHPLDQCELFQAEVDGTPVAALMVFCHGPRAWYFYGASSDLNRERMPTYLLQWEAMRWARSQGCTHYDLWGVPDRDEADLEAGFETTSGGLWGVYRFKRGFGGRLVRSAGPWDRVYQPLIYRLYLYWVSRRNNADAALG